MLLQLLYNPNRIGISRHIEMQDLTPVVADDEKAVQNTNCAHTRWSTGQGGVPGQPKRACGTTKFNHQSARHEWNVLRI
jgi:hypothetical protein